VITFSIDGTVTERPSGAPLPGLFVKAFDKDLLFDDLLGSDVSNARGRFRIVTELRDFTDILDKRPDLYFRVYRSDRRTLVHTTERAVRWSAGPFSDVAIQIPWESLRGAGARTRAGGVRGEGDPAPRPQPPGRRRRRNDQ
jgi:hypothetical protein